MGPRATPRELAGLRRASAELRTIARRYPDRIPGALYRRAEAIMTRSKNEFVPVEFGVLRDSGHVNPPTRERTAVRVTMAYGGAAAAYAIAVHEHPSRFSPPSWQGVTVHFASGRGPKYLERPLFEAVRTLAEDLAADLRVDAA